VVLNPLGYATLMSQLRKLSSVVPPSTYIGERAGNAVLGEIVTAFRVRGDQFPYTTTTIETKQIYSTSQLLSTLTG